MGVWTPGPDPTEDDDTFTGDDSDESENGLGGDDVMNGNGGDDTLRGAGGDDTLRGDDGEDTLIGGAGNDTIRDVSFNDVIDDIALSIDGGDGDDTITTTAGREGTIAGGEDKDGEDTDTLVIEGGVPATSITELTITGVERLFTSGVNIIATIDQLEAFDTIQLTPAQPSDPVTLTLADSGTIDLSDELLLCAGVVTANAGGNTITTGDFGDSIFGGAGIDVFKGGDGNDTLNGGGQDDTLIGGKGGDTLNGGDGSDTIKGGDGNDSIVDAEFADIGTAAVSIDAGAGNDTITVVPNQDGTIDGGDDTDTLIVPGGFPATSITDLTITGVETLFTSGVNVVATVAQFDAFDTIQVNSAQASDTVTLTLADGGTIDLSDEVAGRACAVAASSGGNKVTGGALNDVLTGAAGVDTFNGGDGDDALAGAGGNDKLTGGLGNDTLDGGVGNDTISSGDGNDSIFEASGADIGVATVAIAAGSGNDTITILAGQTGAIAGGDDTDTLVVLGGGGSSLIGFAINSVETLSTSGVNIFARVAQFDAFDTIRFTAADGTTAVTLTLADSGTIDLSDEIAGRAATVFASADGNTVTTGDFNDTMVGAAGADVFKTGDGIDTLNGHANADRLNGGRGDDTLVGEAAEDALKGGQGNDSLNGGDGKDTLAGSAGDDRFVYGAAADSTSVNFDIVKKADFAADAWDVSNPVTGIDATVAAGNLSSGAQFDAKLAAAVSAGQLGANHAVIFTPTAGNLAGTTFLIVDQNGVAGYQAGADLVMELRAPKHLGNLDTGDFI